MTPQSSHILVKHHIFWYNLGFPNPFIGNQVRHILIILFFLLLSFPLFGQSKEKPCYVSVTSSDDFNQTLISNISISVISQYLKNVKPIPSSGLRGKEHCIYEVTATLWFQYQIFFAFTC